VSSPADATRRTLIRAAAAEVDGACAELLALVG
jgi:hypothetical protein